MKTRNQPIPCRRSVLAGPLLLLLALSACDQGKNTYVPPPPPQVTIAHPLRQPVTDYLKQTGTASAVASVTLVARVPGYLQSMSFTDGSMVDKGKLLFVIEQAPYKANLDLAEATLAQQQAQLTRAGEEYDRQLRLVKQSAGSQANVEKWLAERNSAAAAVDEAKANIEIAQINLGYTEVKAPFRGRIGRHLVDAGNLVGSPTPTSLAVIDEIQPIYVYFNLDESTVLRIRAAMRARGLGPSDIDKVPVYVGLQNEDGYPHEGKLDFVATGIDTSTGTLQVRALLPNDDRAILPGMFVRVHVPVERDKDSLLVSNRLLAVDQTGTYLLVVNTQDVVEQRTVEIGALVDGNRVITKGLQADDWVVVEGIQRAAPGTKVSVTRQKEEKSAPASQTAGESASPDESGSQTKPGTAAD